MGIEFREVAQRLTCEQFARSGELPVKGNRAKCPACDHPDHYNLSFFRDGRCRCFKCAFTGDVVQLAAVTWHVSRVDAARTLNQEFHLGLSDGGPDPAILKQRQLERATQLEEQREREERWLTHCDKLTPALDEFHAACADLRRYNPDDLTPDGVQALTRAAVAKAQLDDVWSAMCGEPVGDPEHDVLLDLLSGRVVMDT